MIETFSFGFVLFDLFGQDQLGEFLYFLLNLLKMEMYSLLHHFICYLLQTQFINFQPHEQIGWKVNLYLQVKSFQQEHQMGINQMAIFRLVNTCCKQQSDQQTVNQIPSLATQKTIFIQQDYKRFQNESWFRFRKSLCFDPKKFIFLYHRYDQEQTKLIKHWRNIDMKNAQFGRIGDPDDVKSERWKYAIRRGVPIIYYKAIISVIFNRNFSILNVKSTYQKLLIQHKIDQNKSKLPPMFGLTQTSIKQAIFAPFFNELGYKAIQNILRLLQKTRGGRLTYNPYLVHLIALFLIFFQEEQVYDLVTIMIDSSANTNDRRIESLRWHCVFKEEQSESIAESFYILIGSKSGTIKKLAKHFDTVKIDKIKIFKNTFQNFFWGVLPFKTILRVFILFLNEGIKFIFRLFYSLFKGCEIMLKECQTTDKCLIVLRKRWIACEDWQYEQLLKSSYNIVMEKYTTMKIEESFCENKENIVYYIPFIKKESEILTFDDLETIWDYLPPQLQHYDVEKVFPTEQKTQQNQLMKYLEIIDILQRSDLCLLIIKTVGDGVFGVFLARGLIKDNEGYVGHSQNFAFQLSPTKMKYSSTGQNVFYLIQKKDCIQVGGGGNGPALRLKQNLEVGQSFRSATYKNQPLHGKRNSEFKIKQIELFVLY